MKKFIELARYVRTFWQWENEEKRAKRFILKVRFGYNPKTGEWT